MHIKASSIQLRAGTKQTSTAAAPAPAPDHYRVAVALAGNLGKLQAEMFTLKADNARLQNAVGQLLEENESITAGFELVLVAAERKGTSNA